MFILYLTTCFVLCFFPLEHYCILPFREHFPRKKSGAILIWQVWLNVLIDIVFLGKGWLLCLLGIYWLNDPLPMFVGCLLALLSETFSPLRQKRRIVALGLGFLTGWQIWTAPVAFLLALLILILSTSTLSRSSPNYPGHPRRKS